MKKNVDLLMEEANYLYIRATREIPDNRFDPVAECRMLSERQALMERYNDIKEEISNAERV